MTNETVRGFITAFNARDFPSFVALRTLTEAVVLGYVWPERPTGRANESSDKVYFILSGSQCVGVVYEMGFKHSGNPFEENNLHWYVLEEHRGKGHLHAALRDCILPHIFSDGRESQRVTADSKKNADYIARQGFSAVGDMEFIIRKDQIDLTRAPSGVNSPLSCEDKGELKARLREAKALVTSVHERLTCAYGYDDFWLDELAERIENDYAYRLPDLNNEGKVSQ